MKKHGIFFLFALLAFTSCNKMLLDEGIDDTPEKNFDYLWSEYDRTYGLFAVKKLNWDSVYSVYRPQLTPQTDQAELYALLKEMLALFNDNHVSLIPTNPQLPNYSSGLLDRLGPQEDFYFELIKTAYLTEFKTYSDNVHTGRLSGNIGYIHMAGFVDPKGKTEKWIDEILTQFRDSKGLVFDIRDNGGGADANAQAVADRFAAQNTLYMYSRKRNGPKHGDFAAPVYWYVRPDGEAYRKPVILLTSRYSVSAAETFSLAMSVIPTVTLLGDTTSGAFSDAVVREMPNGWQFTVSVGEFRDATGHCPEGIGVIPDIFLRNTRQDIESGHDKVLEKAMQLLE